jgi:hypothetical protein
LSIGFLSKADEDVRHRKKVTHIKAYKSFLVPPPAKEGVRGWFFSLYGFLKIIF